MTPKKARAILKANAKCLKRVYSKIEQATQTGSCTTVISLDEKEVTALRTRLNTLIRRMRMRQSEANLKLLKWGRTNENEVCKD